LLQKSDRERRKKQGTIDAADDRGSMAGVLLFMGSPPAMQARRRMAHAASLRCRLEGNSQMALSGLHLTFSCNAAPGSPWFVEEKQAVRDGMQ
jgi:hypothetical protein